MTFVLLWLTSLGAALCFVAVGVAEGMRRSATWRRYLVAVGATIPPAVPGMLVLAWTLPEYSSGPAAWSYAVSWMASLVVGSSALIVYGSRRGTTHADEPHAVHWPQKALLVAIPCCLVGWIAVFAYADAVARIQLLSLQTEAYAVASSVAPSRSRPAEDPWAVYQRVGDVLGGTQGYTDEHFLMVRHIDTLRFDASNEALRRYYEARRHLVPSLHEAARMGCAAYPGYSALDMRAPGPSLNKCRAIANFLVLDARMRCADDDVANALKSIGAVWALAANLYHTPDLIACAIGNCVDAIAGSGLECVLHDRPIDTESVREFQGKRFTSAVCALRCALVSRGAERLLRVADPFGNAILTPSSSVGAYAWRVFLSEYEVSWGRAANLYETEATMVSAGERWVGVPLRRSPRPPTPGGPAASDGVFDADAIGRGGADAEASYRLSMLALAASAYRAERGAYPDRLDDLVPRYIDMVPRDPHVAAELRMKKTDGGLILYSVGADQDDDGGGSRRGEFGSSQDDGDLTFCLGTARDEFCGHRQVHRTSQAE